MCTFNLQHLKYFYDTIRLGGVSQAAKKNHVSQSAVSQGIAKLESCFNKSLLVHQKNRIQLTEDGQICFAQAGDVFKSVTQLEESLHAPPGIYKGQVVVACTHSLAQSMLTPLCLQLRLRTPEIKLNLRFGHTALVQSWLAEGSIDFGIVLDNEDLSPFETSLLHRGSFQLFRSATSALPLHEINAALFTEPRPEVHMLKRAFHERFEREIVTLMEISSWEMISTLVSESSLVGFFPDYLLLNSVRADALLPCDLGLPEIPYRLFLMHDRKAPLSRSACLFFEMIKTHFSQHTKTH